MPDTYKSLILSSNPAFTGDNSIEEGKLAFIKRSLDAQKVTDDAIAMNVKLLTEDIYENILQSYTDGNAVHVIDPMITIKGMYIFRQVQLGVKAFFLDQKSMIASVRYDIVTMDTFSITGILFVA